LFGDWAVTRPTWAVYNAGLIIWGPSEGRVRMEHKGKEKRGSSGKRKDGEENGYKRWPRRVVRKGEGT